MKKLATAAAITLVLGAAAAKADDHLTAGTPGDPNCVGQTMAYYAQAFKNGIIPPELQGHPGVAGDAIANSILRGYPVSVKDVKAVAEGYCSSAP